MKKIIAALIIAANSAASAETTVHPWWSIGSSWNQISSSWSMHCSLSDLSPLGSMELYNRTSPGLPKTHLVDKDTEVDVVDSDAEAILPYRYFRSEAACKAALPAATAKENSPLEREKEAAALKALVKMLQDENKYR